MLHVIHRSEVCHPRLALQGLRCVNSLMSGDPAWRSSNQSGEAKESEMALLWLKLPYMLAVVVNYTSTGTHVVLHWSVVVMSDSWLRHER